MRWKDSWVKELHLLTKSKPRDGWLDLSQSKRKGRQWIMDKGQRGCHGPGSRCDRQAIDWNILIQLWQT